MNGKSRQSGNPFERMDAWDQVSMHEADRERARNAMRNADWAVDLVVRAVDDLGALAAVLRRGAASLLGSLGRLTRLSGADVEREAFLAQAVDAADLERRIRDSERRSQPVFNAPHSAA
jgi:uncharacterized protein DUF3563